MRRAIVATILPICAALFALTAPTSTDAQQAKGKKYALLVGVKEYTSSKFTSLEYTENDVEKLAAVLKARAGFDEVRLLTSTRGGKSKGDAPTAANIRKALAGLLAKKGKGDTVLIAFSGHGVQLEVEDGKGKAKSIGYFCPSDSDLTDAKYDTGKSESMVNIAHLFDDLGNCGASAKLVIMDACRNEVSARSLDARRVEIPEGVAALFSCKPGQRAFESKDLKHGVFFHHLIEGIEGEAADRKGRVTWGSLSEYVTEAVQKRVPELIGGGAKQTPHEIKNLVGSTPVLATGIVFQAETGGKEKLQPASPVVIQGGGSEIDDAEVARLKSDVARKRKTELLRDILLDLPTTLTARARSHDSDDYDADTSKLDVDVSVMPNPRAYNKYLRELQRRLELVKIGKDSTIIKAKPIDLQYFFTLPKASVKGFDMARDKATSKLAGPDVSKLDDAWCIWVLTDASLRYDETHWSGYVVDADPVKVLRAVHGKLSMKVDLLDGEGRRINGEEFDLGEVSGRNQWLGMVTRRSKAVANNSFTGEAGTPLFNGASVVKLTSDFTYNAYLGPLLFHNLGGLFWNIRDGSASYTPLRTYRRQYKVTKAEFEKLKSIRCTLVFTKTKPKE